MVGEPLYGVGTPLLSSKNFTWGHFMKIECMVTDVTPVEFSDRAEHAIMGLILAMPGFGQFVPYLRSGSHFVM